MIQQQLYANHMIVDRLQHNRRVCAAEYIYALLALYRLDRADVPINFGRFLMFDFIGMDRFASLQVIYLLFLLINK